MTALRVRGIVAPLMSYATVVGLVEKRTRAATITDAMATTMP